MRVKHQAAPVGVHHRVTLASLDLLACIIAARATALGGLGALAVDHRRSRPGLAPGAPAHDQVVVQALEHAPIAQAGEPTVDGPPGREAVGQQAPRSADTQHVEDGVDHLALWPSPPATLTTRPRQQLLQQAPLGVGQVTRISQPHATMLSRSGRGPHRVVGPRSRNPLESRRGPAIHPANTRLEMVAERLLSTHRGRSPRVVYRLSKTPGSKAPAPGFGGLSSAGFGTLSTRASCR